ncbi:MAG: hypothetical protein LBO09_04710 [Candidatus Peribacteria bacterium]|nr:hypothetical protein [Candidatus Peribacteria bacterium]
MTFCFITSSTFSNPLLISFKEELSNTIAFSPSIKTSKAHSLGVAIIGNSKYIAWSRVVANHHHGLEV